MDVEEGQQVPGHALPFDGNCRWLISLDYDETLRSHDPQQPVPAAFYELMRTWRPLGVRWGINTGRTLPYLCGELLPPAPYLPDFICTCERYVYMARPDGVLQPLTEHNAICMEANMEVRRRVTPLLHAQLARLRSDLPRLEWIIAKDDPLSVEAVDSATMDEIMAFLSPFIATLQGVTPQRAGRYMRLADSRYCKGKALQVVAQRWMVPAASCVLLGDGHNDLQAFRLFPESFCGAPANAHPEVLSWLRENGGYVASTTGVMEILQAWHARAMTETR